VEALVGRRPGGRRRWTTDWYEIDVTASFRRARTAMPSPGARGAADTALHVVARRLTEPVYEEGTVYHHDFDGDGDWYRLLMTIGFAKRRWWAVAVDVFVAPPGPIADSAGSTPPAKVRQALTEWKAWSSRCE
jgi:hypothetical protein